MDNLDNTFGNVIKLDGLLKKLPSRISIFNDNDDDNDDNDIIEEEINDILDDDFYNNSYLNVDASFDGSEQEDSSYEEENHIKPDVENGIKNKKGKLSYKQVEKNMDNMLKEFGFTDFEIP